MAMMHKIDNDLIEDLKKVLEPGRLPVINEMTVELGSDHSRLRFCVVQQLFSSYRVQYVDPNREYACMDCRLQPDHPISFRTHVAFNTLDGCEEGRELIRAADKRRDWNLDDPIERDWCVMWIERLGLSPEQMEVMFAELQKRSAAPLALGVIDFCDRDSFEEAAQ
jgi:hypothetical protein